MRPTWEAIQSQFSGCRPFRWPPRCGIESLNIACAGAVRYNFNGPPYAPFDADRNAAPDPASANSWRFGFDQAAKEEAWPNLQRWIAWAFDDQRSRRATEDSIRHTMDYQAQPGIALAGFHRFNGEFAVRTALDVTDEPDVYETGYWVAPQHAGQGMATEAANAAIRYAFGHLAAKAISIGYFDGNEPSRRIVEKLGFQKIGVARRAATRCLDGAKLDRHEYILTTPDALPELDVSWG